MHSVCDHNRVNVYVHGVHKVCKVCTNYARSTCIQSVKTYTHIRICRHICPLRGGSRDASPTRAKPMGSAVKVL